MIRAAQDANLLGPGRRVPQVDIPSTDQHADLPKKERIDGKKLQEFIWQQYQDGQGARRPHAKTWKMVQSIMHNKFFFRMDGGQYHALAPDRTNRRTRAVAHIMKPRYRLEEGRLASNQLGVSVKARLGSNARRFYRALSGQAALEDWIERSEAELVHKEACRHLLYYGSTALHLWNDPLEGMVRISAVPGTQIMPISHEASSPEKADGLMRVQLMTRQWLEMEDEKLERRLGHKRFEHMARQAGQQSQAIGGDLVGLTDGEGGGGRVDGALVISFWIKANEHNPIGQFGFMVGDRLFRYESGYDEKHFSTALLNGRAHTHGQGYAPGRIPLEMMHYLKLPDDFYGYSFAEPLVGPQREVNRQLGAITQSAVRNKPLVAYDVKAIDSSNILDEASMLLPVRNVPEGGRSPLWHFPAQTVGRDVGAVLQLVDGLARHAVNHESDILSGKQEGRTEGGPATQLLNANANAPLQSVLDGISRTWGITLREVLDKLKRDWGKERTVRTSSRLDLGRELMLKEDDIPWSSEVEVSPNPMLPGGRNAMVQLLFALRQMPADDGKGYELKSRELRRALSMLGLSPPGLELVDPAEQRIVDRILLLINDGKQPAIPSVMEDPESQQVQAIEDHALAVRLLKQKILDPGYRYYDLPVRKALWDELEFHNYRLQGTHSEKFDDDIEAKDDLDAENFMRSQEDDFSNTENDVTVEGLAVGLP